jgi:hypothetical protein
MSTENERESTLQTKNANPKKTTTPTPAMMPVIVGSNVPLGVSFELCPRATDNRIESTKKDVHSLGMLSENARRLQIIVQNKKGVNTVLQYGVKIFRLNAA